MRWHETDLATTPLWLWIGLVLGHAFLSLTILSRAHALGLSPKWMTRLSAAPLVLPAIIAALIGWLMLTRRFGEWPAVARDYAYLCVAVAFLIAPAITIARRFRRDPAGVTVRVTRGSLGLSGSFVGHGPHAWMLGLRGNESLSLQVTSAEVALPEVAASFGVLRVLHLSDLHFATCYRRAYFEAVAACAADWNADLVVFTGDLLDDDATLDWTDSVLGRLRGRLGQYAILGNHDVVHRPGRVRRAIRAAGFQIIDGRWLRCDDGGRSLALGGTSAPWGPKLDMSSRPEADATIVLSHSPDQFPAIARSGSVDLVLSGHNHGGQIRLPVVGPLVMPSLYGRRYDRGFFKRGRTLMEITQGIGGKHPLRYGCPPEIVRLVLTGAGTTAPRFHPEAATASRIAF